MDFGRFGDMFFPCGVKSVFHVFAMCVSNFGHVLRHVEILIKVFTTWVVGIGQVLVQFWGRVFARKMFNLRLLHPRWMHVLKDFDKFGGRVFAMWMANLGTLFLP